MSISSRYNFSRLQIRRDFGRRLADALRAKPNTSVSFSTMKKEFSFHKLGQPIIVKRGLVVCNILKINSLESNKRDFYKFVNMLQK